MSGPDAVAPGDELPTLRVRFSRETLVRYAGASGDFNPIHYSDHFATRLGLPGVVAHGMLTMGAALRVVTDWVGDPSLVRSWSCRFSRPVVVPDDADGAELVVTATVQAVAGPEADGERVATVAVEAVCAGERVLRGGQAEVLLPSGRAGTGV